MTETAGARQAGRYEILHEIGRGGVSVVHLAHHVELGRLVALKELAAFHAAKPGAAARFVRESRLAGSLAHPNVVTVYDFFEDGGTAFIAMEYLPHGSLRPFVGTLGLAHALTVVDGVLSGLERAEAAGVVHRDLKPENLLLAEPGIVKIGDFGIAKASSRLRDEGFHTAPGTTVGTPEYMAPEQALGGDIGPWTDLYAVGVIAYELLGGRVPFPGREDDEALAIVLRHVNEPVVPLRELDASIDPGLAAWVERLLAKDPAQRPAAAQDAGAELEELALRLVGPRWRREGRLVLPDAGAAAPDRAAVVAATTAATRRPQPSPPADEPARPRRRRRVVLALAAVIAAAAGTAVGVDRDEPASPVTVQGDLVRLTAPAGWTRTAQGLAGTEGGAGARGPGGASLTTGVTAGSGPELLPASLRRGLGTPARVRLGELTALRYSGGGAATWAVPLGDGVLAVRCAPARVACTRAAATVRPRRETLGALGPTQAYASRLRDALAPLGRLAERATGARTSAGRRRAARSLEAGALSALNRLGPRAPGAWESAAHDRLRAAAREVSDAAQPLAATASSTSRRRVRAAEAGLERALRELREARAAFAELGYDVSDSTDPGA